MVSPFNTRSADRHIRCRVFDSTLVTRLGHVRSHRQLKKRWEKAPCASFCECGTKCLDQLFLSPGTVAHSYVQRLAYPLCSSPGLFSEVSWLTLRMPSLLLKKKHSIFYVEKCADFSTLLWFLLTLTHKVNAFSTELRRNSRIMDELDATLSFANLATEMNFIRPTLKDE